MSLTPEQMAKVRALPTEDAKWPRCHRRDMNWDGGAGWWECLNGSCDRIVIPKEVVVRVEGPQPETIQHAAVKTKDESGFLKGKCHADCFRAGAELGLAMSSRAICQGFVTSSGRYVDREEAARIAHAAKQIDEPHRILFSEDLWSERSGGRYDYDKDTGYKPRKNGGAL